MGFSIWLCSDKTMTLLCKLWFLVWGRVENWRIHQHWRRMPFCRCLSRPKSFWSTCMKSRWLISSRTTPCCTDTLSRWPPWSGCGSGSNRCEPICSAAGQRWRRICAAGKSHNCQIAPVCFSFPLREGGYVISKDLSSVDRLRFCGSPSGLIFACFLGARLSGWAKQNENNISA